LDRRKVRRAGKRRIQRRCRQTAEIEQPSEIQFKNSFWNSDEADITTKLEVVISGDEVDVVSELVTSLCAYYW
jgi:hypothetical protein